MENSFYENSQLIRYNDEKFQRFNHVNDENFTLSFDQGDIIWFNTYGINYFEEFKKVVEKLEIDDFILKLMRDDDHPNKIIEMDNSLFIAINILKTDNFDLDTEQIYLIFYNNFLWTIQEKVGDYFEWIRERLKLGKGIIRHKNADYLLYLILESIVDNYSDTLDKYIDYSDKKFNISDSGLSPKLVNEIGRLKQNIFQLKRSSISLRETVTKIGRSNTMSIDNKFFSDLKEQLNNLIDQIDFEINELESKVNMIFSLQGNRLNEVMKTLTIFSVIFIPITFLAGLYGMNFKYIPELEYEYGYFVLLGIMVLVVLASIIYFKRKRWF